MNKQEIKKLEDILSKVWKKCPELYYLVFFIPLMAGVIALVN